MTDPNVSNPADEEGMESLPMDHATMIEGLLDPEAVDGVAVVCGR